MAQETTATAADTLAPPTAGRQIVIRILIVEDHPDTRKDYCDYIDKFGKELPRDWGVVFDKTAVGSATQARHLLKKAAEEMRPFDLMFLDLSIPAGDERGHAKSEYGLDLNKLAEEIGSVKHTVVFSGELKKITADVMVESWNQRMTTIERKGPKGQIPVSVLRKHIQHVIDDYRFSNASSPIADARPEGGLEVSRDRGEAESAELLAQRIQELVPYAERCVVYSFGLCFSRCLGDVERNGDALQGELLGRLNLDLKRDSEDFLVQQLLEIDRSLKTGRSDWAELQTSLGLNFEAAPQQVEIREIIEGLLQKFDPCVTFKEVRIFDSRVADATAISFDSEARAIVSEMISGTLAACSDSLRNPWLELSSHYTDKLGVPNSNGDWIEVRLEDNLKPLPPVDVEVINKGFGVYRGERFTRAWGLFVMQHIALQGGGRLKVETSGDGNAIVYRIPRARTDKKAIAA